MQNTLGIVFVSVLGAGSFLYLVWKLVKAFDRRKRQREEKAKLKAGEGRICRYGVNADGEITRIQVRRLPRESDYDTALSDIPDFLRVKPAGKK